MENNKPKLNALFTKPTNEKTGYIMTTVFSHVTITELFLDSMELELESLWNRAKDLTIPKFETVEFLKRKITYECMIGRMYVGYVEWHFKDKHSKERCPFYKRAPLCPECGSFTYLKPEPSERKYYRKCPDCDYQKEVDETEMKTTRAIYEITMRIPDGGVHV